MTRTDRKECTEGWPKHHGQHKFQFTEVPIHFSQEIAHFPRAYIDVYVNAVRLRLAIDTGHGLGSFLLSPSILSGLDVQYTGRTQENYDAFGKRYDSREYLLSDVTIGDLHLEQVTGYELFTRWGTPGLIGLPFLRQFNVLIDYPNLRFGLYRKHTHPGYLVSQAWTKVQLVSPSTRLVLPVRLGGCDETFRFLLDTGAAYVDEGQRFYDLVCSQSKLGEWLRQRKAIKPCPAEPEILGKFGTDQLRTLCGYGLTQTDFVIVDQEYLKMDGLLGHRFFAEYSAFIDFTTSEIYLRPRTVESGRSQKSRTDPSSAVNRGCNEGTNGLDAANSSSTDASSASIPSTGISSGRA